MSWKSAARRDPGGFYRLPHGRRRGPHLHDRGAVRGGRGDARRPDRNTRRFPGVVDVAITPDAHHGYGVPVGCVIATTGTLAMGPVGYDIGCGMAALRAASRASGPRPSGSRSSRGSSCRAWAWARAPRASRSRRSGSRRSCAAGPRPSARGAAPRSATASRSRTSGTSRRTRGPGAGSPARQPGRRQPLHRAAARRRAALGHVPHGLARLRPRPGLLLLRAGAARSWASSAGRWTSGTSRRGRATGAPTRTPWPPAATTPSPTGCMIGRAVARRFRGDLRRRGRDGLRDQPQPGPGGEPPRPLRPTRSGCTARARRAPCPPGIRCWRARPGRRPAIPCSSRAPWATGPTCCARCRARRAASTP